MSFEEHEHLRDHEVRLFPVVRISSEREAELRATASLLAMVRAVSEFGQAVVRMAKGRPSGNIYCYTEVPFEVEKEGGRSEELRPDGIIHVVRGKKEWKALLEVKVGANPIKQEQFDAYHRLAKDNQCDALITISNQPAKSDGLPPITVNRRLLRSVSATHLSWERLLSEAQMLSRKKAIDDPDQKWMMDEWIRYVEDENSKIIEEPDLGVEWSAILQEARSGSLKAVSQDLKETVRHWDGFLRKAALRMRAKLGAEVKVKIPRRDRQDPEGRLKRLHGDGLKTSRLSGVLQVPDAVGDLSIDVILQSQRVRYRVSLEPPTEGRPMTRVNWLTRQLRGLPKPPPDLAVTVCWNQRKLLSKARMDELREDSLPLMHDTEKVPVPKGALPKEFILEWTRRLQKSRGRSSAKVLRGIFSDLEVFYRDVVEGLVPAVSRAPRFPKEATEDSVEEKKPGTSQDPTPTEQPTVTTPALEGDSPSNGRGNIQAGEEELL